MPLPIAKFCHKCEGTWVTQIYHRDNLDVGCRGEHGEHLHYTCTSCGYDWTGPTADNKPKR